MSGRVMSHIWMLQSICRIRCLGIEACHAYEWVMSHVWMSHVTHMNESCHAYEWAMSQVWTSAVTHMNWSCHTYEWYREFIHELSRALQQLLLKFNSCTAVCCSVLQRVSHVTQVGHDSFMKSRGQLLKFSSCSQKSCVTGLIQKRDMTHLRVWHDSFTRVKWHIHKGGITHLHGCDDSISENSADAESPAYKNLMSF